MGQRRVIEFAQIALGVMACTGVAFAAGNGPTSAPAPAGHATAASKKAPPAALVDVNSASRAQLKTLPGIGEAQADKIIAGRPYVSKADLATKSVIPTGIYLSLKDRIIARQKMKTKGKA